MQPYRNGTKCYDAEHLPGVRVVWRDSHASVEWTEKVKIYSSAVYRGGHSTGTRIVNYMVDRFFDCSDPVQHMQNRCEQWGYVPNETVGLITAAKVTHMSVDELEGDQFSILCCASAGTSNAARAGVERETYSAYVTPQDQVHGREHQQQSGGKQHTPGTINIMIVLDGLVHESAIFNALITITEAKTAALQDLGILDRETGLSATGTTTDAIAIAVHNCGRYTSEHQYAGVATTLGNALGMLVYRTVKEAAATQFEEDAELFPRAEERKPGNEGSGGER
ncbi:adenosylcobinamide amidohydrolase [Paenibacillus marinisediminis]